MSGELKELIGRDKWIIFRLRENKARKQPDLVGITSYITRKKGAIEIEIKQRQKQKPP